MVLISAERKRILNSVCINFFSGVIVGTILFYSQFKGANFFEADFEIERRVSFEDVFRIAWMNMLWLVSVFLARCVAPMSYMHPIILIRGLINGFSASCIIHQCGAIEAAAVILPQVMTLVVMLAAYSVILIEKRKKAVLRLKEPNVLKKADIMLMMLFSLVSAGAEIVFFRLFVLGLF